MQSHYFFLTILISLFHFSLNVQAQISTDGTLGPASNLSSSDSDYKIGPDLGQQLGGNLFHSFRDFNIRFGESATFSGPDSVNNIISRVTGGNPSRINGTFRSTIPNADVYFLNPYGILFGEGASLDVQGSFHASTADYLRFSDGNEFNARNPEQPLLTVAPIESFGFLTDAPAPITVTDAKLSVSEGKTLSLIGGDLTINGKLPKFISEEINIEDGEIVIKDGEIDYLYGGVPDIEFSSTLLAKSGQIYLAGVASQGEVIPTEHGINLGTDTQGGQVVINNSEINVSGEGGGNIFIRGGQIVVSESFVESRTEGNKDGGVINIQGNSLSFKDGTRIIAITYDKGQGSDVTLQATESVDFFGTSRLHLKEPPGGSRIYIESHSENEGAGDAGNLLIEAKNISVAKASEIYAATRGGGKGGNVTLRADESVIFSGGNNLGSGNQVYVQTHFRKDGAGQGGDFVAEANEIVLKDGAMISLSTTGKGQGGTATLRAKGKIILYGIHEKYGTGEKTYGSGVLVTSQLKNIGGQAGNLFIEAGELHLADGAYLTTSAYGFGNGGNIDIKVNGKVTVEGASARGWVSWIGANSNPRFEKVIGGESGSISIDADKLIIKDGGVIAASSLAPANKEIKSAPGGNITINISGAVNISGVNPYGKTEDGLGSGIYVNSSGEGAGKAGIIFLTAKSLSITDGGVISSSTTSNEAGGKIDIHVDGELTISGNSVGIVLREPSNAQNRFQTDFPDEIQTVSSSSIVAFSSSEDNDAGNAGEISISAKSINITESGLIDTATENAAGGNISITTSDLLHLRDGNITTDVKGGESDGGNITIEAPIFVVLDGAQIITQAERGFGGDIKMDSEKFLTSTNKYRLDASSKVLERSGEIIITTPEEDISGNFIGLAITPINADDLLRNICAGVTRRTLSKFIVIDRNVPPKTPADSKSHYIRRADAPKPEVMPEQLF